MRAFNAHPLVFRGEEHNVIFNDDLHSETKSGYASVDVRSKDLILPFRGRGRINQCPISLIAGDLGAGSAKHSGALLSHTNFKSLYWIIKQE